MLLATEPSFQLNFVSFECQAHRGETYAQLTREKRLFEREHLILVMKGLLKEQWTWRKEGIRISQKHRAVKLKNLNVQCPLGIYKTKG